MDDIVVNGTNNLICAMCFAENEEKKGAIGICKECKFYLCGTCTVAHQHHPEYRAHHMAYFYCAQKLRTNRYVRANSFCLDCGQYLCDKCVMDHGGYWEYRHHAFIGRRGHTLDEIPLDYKQTPAPKTRRRPTTKSTYRSIEGDGRKSPYSLPEIILPKKQKISITEAAKPRNLTHKLQNSGLRQVLNKPRKLVHSTVGRQSDNETQSKTPKQPKTNKTKRPRSVHYEDEEQSTEATLLGAFSVKAPEDQRPCRVVATVYLANDTLAMADSANRNIKLFDRNCQFASSLQMEMLPLAICASQMNPSEMYASSGHRIHQVATERGLHVVSAFDTEIPRIEGITLWKSGIAAIFRSVRSKVDKKGHWEVHLMSYEGIVKFEIVISTPLVVKLVTPIWYISCNESGDEIFISDTHNNRILCIDIINWHVVYVIKGKDTSGAPRSIATDADGNVLVAWYDEVHSISQTGADLGVPVPNIGRGSVIAYNPRTQKLAVWSDKKTQSNKFSIYQL